MNKFITIILATAIALNSCSKKENITLPTHKDLVQAVYASGRIYPLNSYKVYSKLPGYVGLIHVSIGDPVVIGQELITLRSEVSELNVNTAKNVYDLAQRNARANSPLINSLKEDLASAKSKFDLDSVNYGRFFQLYNNNAASKIQYDQSKSQLDISRQNFLKAANNLLSTQDRLITEMENARMQYEAQVTNKSEYTLTAAVKGKVYDLMPKEGELVNTQMALFEIGDASKFEVELSVDETDIALIKKNQEIIYSIDAYGDKTYYGKVMEVYPRIDRNNKTSKIIATIDLDKETKVYSGMSLEANIVIASRKNTLVIPREYLINGNKVRRYKTNDTIMVVIGAQDLEFVEIISGIDKNTLIEKP